MAGEERTAQGEAGRGRAGRGRRLFRGESPAWLSALLGLALVAALAWGGWEHSARLRMQTALEARYQQAFYDTLDRSAQAEVALDKALVAATPARRAYQLQEVWRYASQAQSSLALLPLSGLDLSPTRKFLAQLGDYAHTLADQMSAGSAPAGGSLAQAQVSQLALLRRALSQWNGQLQATSRNLTARHYLWSAALEPRPALALHLPWAAGRRARAEAPAPRASSGARGAAVPVVDPLFAGLAAANRAVDRLPSLAYDGPFADQALAMTPRAPGGAPVTAAAAQRVALAWAEASRGRGGGPAWSLSGSAQSVHGPLPVYRFSLVRRRAGGSEHLTVDVWQAGGHVLSLLSDRLPGRAALGAADARRIAADFVRRLGFPGAVPTYSLVSAGVATVTLADTAPAPGGGRVLLYPDQLKVRVALDNGEVTGFDGLAYWLRHRPRTLPAPRLSAAQAAAVATGGAAGRGLPPADQLSVEGSRLALIPLDSGREVLAWEVRARSAKSLYLIYVNALDGSEEKILLMLPTPGGELTL
ncbi:MAG: germination protein YpeB [Firmicutes bacterium]|nr:germination protein YpeB [Bacillota bacterium]